MWAEDGAIHAPDLPDVTSKILPDGLICRIVARRLQFAPRR